METRFTAWNSVTDIQMETRDNGSPVITGLASVFWDGTPKTEYRTDFCVERIMPTAFDKSLESGLEIVCYFNHNPEIMIGRRSTGTLSLVKEARGIRFINPYRPNDPDSVRAKAKIDDKLMTGASFGFSVDDDGQEFRYEGEQLVRILHSVELIEVSPVYNPAYGGTNIGIRSQSGEVELTNAIRKWRLQNFIKSVTK